MFPVARRGGLAAFALILGPLGAHGQTTPAAPVPAAPAPAPAAPPAPAGPPVGLFPGLGGPLVPGVCLLSREELIEKSKVGQAATARLKAIAVQVEASLRAEDARLVARKKADQAKGATMTPEQIQAEGAAQQRRGQALQQEFGERGHQVEATRAKAYLRILAAAEPYVADAYSARKCGLLLSRETALGGNFADDLTAEVIAAYDAKGSPISFELEPLPPAR
jgi:Skp family chaperone for outer membrane proteins